jgi:hypothetical protein
MAAVETVNIFGSNASNTTFRAWGANVSSHMLDFGMVPVSNNINWTTVVTPAAPATRMGYEIWRFNDALQATAPVFLRFDYGSGPSYASQPRLSFAIGSGASGANLTGPGTTAAATYYIAPYQYTASMEPCYFAGNTGRVLLWMWPGTDSNASIWNTMSLCIERTKSAAGADTGQGLLITQLSQQTMYTAYWDCVLGAFTPSTGVFGGFETPPAMLVPALGTGVCGSNVATYPIFHAVGNAFANPGLNVLGYFNADITANVNTTISVYGSNHTYIGTGSLTVPQTGFRSGGGANAIGLLLRYE